MARSYALELPTPPFLSEPLANTPTTLTTAGLIQAFRWYNDNASDKKASEYLDTDVVTATRFQTLAWAERLLSRGFLFPEKEQKTYLEMKSLFKEHTAKLEVKQAEKPKFDIQAATKAKALDYVGAIESRMDANTAGDANWYEFANSLGVKPLHVGYMVEEIKLIQTQLEKPEVYEQVLTDLERIRKNKNAIRAPRKQKVLKPEKVVGALNYMKKSDQFKVESIDPTSLIGAKSLWTFNTQYRYLTHYMAREGEGLTVKSTTIQNFDTSTSTTKMLRKPLEVLPKVLDMTSRQARKIVDALSTKPTKTSGRINKHTILLKVDKC